MESTCAGDVINVTKYGITTKASNQFMYERRNSSFRGTAANRSNSSNRNHELSVSSVVSQKSRFIFVPPCLVWLFSAWSAGIVSIQVAITESTTIVVEKIMNPDAMCEVSGLSTTFHSLRRHGL